MMSVVTVISRKFVALLLGIVSIIKRLLCFLNLRRRRKNSGTILPMTVDNISSNIQQSVPTMDTSQVELESWDSWGNEDSAMSQSNHSLMSNSVQSNSTQSSHGKLPEPEPEEEIDFFQDMQPSFRKAQKILIRPKTDKLNHSSGGISSRLAMASNIPLTTGSELESWEEGGESAWAAEAEEDHSWEAEEILREKKRKEREERLQEHHRRKQEKQGSRQPAAASQRPQQLSAVRLS